MLRTALTVVGIAGTSATALVAVQCADVVAVAALTLATVWVSIPLFVCADCVRAAAAAGQHCIGHGG